MLKEGLYLQLKKSGDVVLLPVSCRKFGRQDGHEMFAEVPELPFRVRDYVAVFNKPVVSFHQLGCWLNVRQVEDNYPSPDLILNLM